MVDASTSWDRITHAASPAIHTFADLAASVKSAGSISTAPTI
jgi:hypothetical protein